MLMSRLEGFHSNASINFDYISPPLYSTEQLYKYVYFNEMNLAVKSSRSSRRSSPSPAHHISPEAMRIIIDLNREYNE